MPGIHLSDEAVGSFPAQMACVGRQASKTIAGSATALDAAPARAALLELLVETAQIRFTCDGTTTPTATVGRIANVGDTIRLSLADFTKFQAIRTGGTSASVQGDYWG
jgi:hypothetical protein